MSAVTDDGAKFISEHQVVLGGFERAKEELMLIQNLVIAANGPSFIAAEYGAVLMRHLRNFNSVKVLSGTEMCRREIEHMRYAGFLTLSQSGDAKNLIDGIITASRLGVTCINIVNVEDSPITRVIQEVDRDDDTQAQGPKDRKTLVRSDSGLLELNRQTSNIVPNAQFYENDENIGFYMKSGFCYSDVKSFIPQILAMALVSIWFSDKKTTVLDKDMKNRRKALIRDVEMLPERINMTLTDEYIELYKSIAEVLKSQQNLFCLGKGTGFLAWNYCAQKFMQIAGIHAAAYPSGEFRHGPLSMIDDSVKTPGKHSFSLIQIQSQFLITE